MWLCHTVGIMEFTRSSHASNEIYRRMRARQLLEDSRGGALLALSIFTSSVFTPCLHLVRLHPLRTKSAAVITRCIHSIPLIRSNAFITRRMRATHAISTLAKLHQFKWLKIRSKCTASFLLKWEKRNSRLFRFDVNKATNERLMTKLNKKWAQNFNLIVHSSAWYMQKNRVHQSHTMWAQFKLKLLNGKIESARDKCTRHEPEKVKKKECENNIASDFMPLHFAGGHTITSENSGGRQM